MSALVVLRGGPVPLWFAVLQFVIILALFVHMLRSGRK